MVFATPAAQCRSRPRSMPISTPAPRRSAAAPASSSTSPCTSSADTFMRPKGRLVQMGATQAMNVGEEGVFAGADKQVCSIQRYRSVDTMIPDWMAIGDLPRGAASCHLAETRGSAELQSAASAVAGRLPAGLRGVAETRLPVGLSGRQFRGPERLDPGDSDACWDDAERGRRKARSGLLGLPRDRAAQKQRFPGRVLGAVAERG